MDKPVQKESRSFLLKRLRACAGGGELGETFFGRFDADSQFFQTSATVRCRFWNFNVSSNPGFGQGRDQGGLFRAGIADMMRLFVAFENDAVGIEHITRPKSRWLAFWDFDRFGLWVGRFDPIGQGRPLLAFRQRLPNASSQILCIEPVRIVAGPVLHRLNILCALVTVILGGYAIEFVHHFFALLFIGDADEFEYAIIEFASVLLA